MKHLTVIWATIVFTTYVFSLCSESSIKKLHFSNTVFKKNTEITFFNSEEAFNEVAIITPDGKFIEVTNFFRSKGYPSRSKFNFKPLQIYGDYWDDGRPIRIKVFSKKGKYRFYFADDIETEEENTRSTNVIVDYTD